MKKSIFGDDQKKQNYNKSVPSGIQVGFEKNFQLRVNLVAQEYKQIPEVDFMVNHFSEVFGITICVILLM